MKNKNVNNDWLYGIILVLSVAIVVSVLFAITGSWDYLLEELEQLKNF